MLLSSYREQVPLLESDNDEDDDSFLEPKQLVRTPVPATVFITQPFQEKSFVRLGRKICFIGSFLLSLLVVTTVLVLLITYVVYGSVMYDRLLLVKHSNNHCTIHKNQIGSNSPSQFTPYSGCTILNNVSSAMMKQWFVPESNWDKVEFKSRDPAWQKRGGGSLVAYLLLQNPSITVPVDPFIILLHDLRMCKQTFSTLIPGAMLWKAGYNILMLDMRNHGESDEDQHDPYTGFGSVEYRDVLGALDYLITRFPHLNNSNVGLYGSGLGGSVSLVSMAKEKRFKAAFLDSPAADVISILRQTVRQSTRTDFIVPVIMSATRLMSGAKSSLRFPPFLNDPLKSVSLLDASRAIFVQQALGDLIVPTSVIDSLVLTARKARVNVQYYYGDTRVYVDRVPNRCDNHCQLVLSESDEFYKRMRDFFSQQLRS